MPSVVFLLPSGRRVEVAVAPGTTLLEAARLGGVDIEGACGGSMACATCHLWVEEAWFARLPEATPEEEDMLDLAADWAPTSRLGCQIRVTSALDGLTVRVPRSSLLSDA
ncbi:MAG: 2Fe-2S iron-sulfur cluster-binding protein [Geminicoccaceae bacterium]|nr:2Fe-2S iron-sulfur cluster-binding protein [Geminicoccaceae bacterium]MCX8102099.1 2Fe-2S iron-sulfur cluster-binding protein [Geminicoccaceae bacterium]MDW8369715.1 2Fe-2S iron-sulfur cluster-binding protein [Geminicoccaceae bacterium]